MRHHSLLEYCTSSSLYCNFHLWAVMLDENHHRILVYQEPTTMLGNPTPVSLSQTFVLNNNHRYIWKIVGVKHCDIDEHYITYVAHGVNNQASGQKWRKRQKKWMQNRSKALEGCFHETHFASPTICHLHPHHICYIPPPYISPPFRSSTRTNDMSVMSGFFMLLFMPHFMRVALQDASDGQMSSISLVTRSNVLSGRPGLEKGMKDNNFSNF